MSSKSSTLLFPLGIVLQKYLFKEVPSIEYLASYVKQWYLSEKETHNRWWEAYKRKLENKFKEYGYLKD